MIETQNAPVSIIVPTYNRGKLIRQSLESLLQQTLAPREIIVVVDGSTDDTMAILEGYGDRIRVVRIENGGKSKALNYGISLVTQPYTWIFDDDDIACPQALELMYSALMAHPEAGISYGTLDVFYGEWPSSVSSPWRSYQSEDRRALYLMLMQDFFIWQGAMLVRTECYRAVGEFDERFTRSQDYDMALRLLRRFDAVGIPHVIFHQRHHRGDRGPNHARLRAHDAEAVWAGFHRLIAEEIHETHELNEFVCGLTGDLDARSTITALVQRGVIMARAAAWDKAGEDLAEAVRRASAIQNFDLNIQELAALRGVFEREFRSRFGSLQEARRFFKTIGQPDHKIAAKLLGNLLLPVSNRAKLMPIRPDRSQEFKQIRYLARGFLSLSALREYFAARRSEHRLFRVQPLLVHEGL